MRLQREAVFGLMFACGMWMWPSEVAGGGWSIVDALRKRYDTSRGGDANGVDTSGVEDVIQSESAIGAAEGCTNQLDICFLIDSSGSIGIQNFRLVKQFLHTFLMVLPIGPEEVNNAVVTYSTDVHLQWDLQSPNAVDKQLAAHAVLDMPYKKGSTNTSDGLKACKQILFTGSRPGREHVPKLVIGMTDGESDSDFRTVRAAKEIRELGGIVTVLAVGHYVKHSECRSMCGCSGTSDDDSPCPLYLRADWGQLATAIKPMLKEVCKTLPQDAICSDWSAWSPCSVSCGDGSQIRTRTEVSAPQPGTPTCPDCPAPMGRTCVEQGGLEEIRECSAGVCAVDAGCGVWGEWSAWSASCGNATRKRERTRYNDPPPQGAGRRCENQDPPVLQEQTEEATLAPCITIPPTPPEWAAWSDCTVTCGGGNRHRVRNALPPGLGSQNGESDESLVSKLWPGTDLRQEEACNTSPCPINATCGQFEEWSTCSVSCGGGLKTRSRNPWNEDQQHGGLSCEQQHPGGRTETITCNPQACPVDERPGEWAEWGECSVTCGDGVRERRRGKSLVEAKFGGRTIDQQNEALPEDLKIKNVEYEPCSYPACGASCTYVWSDWNKCVCPMGYQARHAAVKFDYRNKPCDLPTFETKACSCGETNPVPSEGTTPGAPGATGPEQPNQRPLPEGSDENETPTNEEGEQSKKESGSGIAGAIAGGVIGGLILLGAAGGASYHYYLSSSVGSPSAEIEYEADDGATKVVMEEEKETLVPVDDDSDMWME
ncbi:microneme protein MIC2 [Toxoplasma gondii ME49]|uniref:Microneme protein MIC2 n=1 Tax=Toxoplasma gondii (strain ATCC 50611 / Me49) TaxID=508771 RepID=S8F9G8_TOXGM|nr:microneme protein MIC2 [Toxoplasma gondii ME49]EPT30283.1 microneme protein MIC2 [Toxoplasma gondii ME49]|eukprot:XP_018637433.1 microneme protein MIC2 [Toxoplasma gondii ME49]